MSPLPAPPADLLHILPSAKQMGWLTLAALALGLLALAVLQRLLRGRSREVAASPPPVPARATAPAPAVGIGPRIKALEEQFLLSKAYREGCHALASLVKTDLEQRTGMAVEEMTSSEIERAFAESVPVGRGALVGGPRLGRFMTGLAGRRYGRNDPRRRHFVEACDQARELLA